MIDLEREVNEINRWISSINGRLDILESILNEKELKDMIAEVRTIKRIIDGDSDLNVPPLYELISSFNDTINNLTAYQKKDQEYHHDMKIIIIGLVSMHIITLILAIIGITT